MKRRCPNFECQKTPNGSETKRSGSYFRPSDGRWIPRFQCKKCGKRFSAATMSPAYGQNKRKINEPLKILLCSGVSMRRCARILKVNRKTIARKLIYLGLQAKEQHEKFLKGLPKVPSFQFDDLQTIEHTKLKPLSVTLAVMSQTRKFLGFRVSVMPATGLLAEKSRKKYGKRKDERPKNLRNLFQEISPVVQENAKITSDQFPQYPQPVRKFFPKAQYERVKGQRGCIAGQGELKKIGFDPLFDLNHTCAMLRANVNRLIRKTWCTTKKKESLVHHLYLYVDFHNRTLTA